MTDATTSRNHDLISSDRVEGTSVYGSDGEKMGSVKSVVLGKRDGKVHHVILSIGGFLGMGDKLHSLPWSKLDYDTSVDGYRLNVTKDQLMGAPAYDRGDEAMASDRAFQERSYQYYGERPSW